MAIVYSYPLISEISTNDTLVISDASNKNKTKSVTVRQLSEYFNSNAVTSELYEKTITLGYDELSALNGGNTTTTFTIPELTSTSAISIVDVIAYLEAGTTAFNLSIDTNLRLGLGSGSNFKAKMSFLNNNFINSSTSVYFNQGVETMTQLLYKNPSPLGAELSIKFDGSGGITQGNGTLTLKVLYKLTDFS